jgi:hypothetical protein
MSSEEQVRGEFLRQTVKKYGKRLVLRRKLKDPIFFLAVLAVCG